jgi:hypothetical protein
MRYLTTLILSLLFTKILWSQGAYVPLGSYGMHFIDRMEIKSGILADPNQFNTTTKAYQRSRIADYANAYDTSKLSKQDRFNLEFLKNDNFEFSKSERSKSVKRFRQPIKLKV